jgi:ribose 5-phosphate isomerase A
MAMLIEPLAITTPIAGFNGGIFFRPDMTIVEEHLLDGDVARRAVELIRRRHMDAWIFPTSKKTAALARRLGVPLTDFAAHRRIDLAIDGADEVERRTLHLIKGRGGALLREKIVAVASARMIVIVDELKLVDCLGTHVPLPVEIVPFGWQTVLDRLAAIGCRPQLRLAEGRPFTTDGYNDIADCAIPGISDPPSLAAVVGVVESGLFVGLASKIMIGRPTGVEVIDRKMTGANGEHAAAPRGLGPCRSTSAARG